MTKLYAFVGNISQSTMFRFTMAFDMIYNSDIKKSCSHIHKHRSCLRFSILMKWVQLRRETATNRWSGVLRQEEMRILAREQSFKFQKSNPRTPSNVPVLQSFNIL